MIFCVIVIGLSTTYYSYHHFTSVTVVKHNTVVDIEPGYSLQQISQQLHQAGVLPYPWLLRLMVRLRRLSQQAYQLEAGEYELTPGMTLEDILHKLVMGEVILHRFCIVPGWKFKQVLNAMRADPYFKHVCSQLSLTQVAQQLNIPHENPEGWLFPDTYFFHKGLTDCYLLQRAYEQMKIFLNQAWQQRDKDLPYTGPYQALIIASMVEKETAVSDEYNQVAGVIVRRLQHHMLLQIDPTVVYAMGDSYQGTITRKDLQIDSPYNTYKCKGLPPTPIALPGAEAIEGSLHPDNSSNLYFVAMEDGRHYFSSNLQQHNWAVKKYIMSKK